MSCLEKPSQIKLPYIRCVTSKRVTRPIFVLRGPPLLHCTRATQFLLKKCQSGGKPLKTLCPIKLARDLNVMASTPETRALPLNQLNNSKNQHKIKKKKSGEKPWFGSISFELLCARINPSTARAKLDSTFSLRHFNATFATENQRYQH